VTSIELAANNMKLKTRTLAENDFLSSIFRSP
jgi:hypothetical protein